MSAQATTTSPKESSPLIRVENPTWGQATITRLDWDSEFFGREFGIVTELKTAAVDRKAAVAFLLTEVSELAAAEGFCHLTFRPANRDWDAVHGAERAGFLLVDTGLDFFIRLPDELPDPRGDIRRSRDDDLPSLREVAGTAFYHSRFYLDPAFSAKEVDAFHREWITNLHGGLAAAVLISESAGSVSGFVCCALQADKGRIPLIAVSEEHRGKGLGTLLVEAALKWFQDAGAREVRVKTQATNVKAVALYERRGFVLERPELTFTKIVTTEKEQES